MLVLTRRENESIFIGDDIEVKILKTGKDTRVGVNAPNNVNIVRKEISHIAPSIGEK